MKGHVDLSVAAPGQHDREDELEAHDHHRVEQTREHAARNSKRSTVDSEAAYPATNRGVVATVATHSETNSGPDAPIIWGSLWAAAWFVLLIACANLANLTLVRTMGRWREFSTRMALGAGQGRMLRQIFVQSLMLAGVAGALGWWITTWCVRTWAVGHRVPLPGPRLHGGCRHAGLFGGDHSVVAAMLFSLAPIGRVVQLGVNGALKGDARGVTQGLTRQTRGGGTGGRSNGSGHCAALGSRRPGAELREYCQRGNRRPRS